MEVKANNFYGLSQFELSQTFAVTGHIVLNDWLNKNLHIFEKDTNVKE